MWFKSKRDTVVSLGPKIRPLTPALQQRAIDELNEDPQRISQDLETFRQWILQQPHIKCRMNSDQFLTGFLRGCKYRLEKAQKKLEAYYTVRTDSPDLFLSFVDEQKARAIIRMGVGIRLPQPLGDDGPRLFLIRTGHYEPSVISIYEIMKLNFLYCDLLLIEDDHCMVRGCVQLLDYSEFSAKHVFQFQPQRMRRITQYMFEALPVRFNATHFFNTGFVFRSALTLVKPIIPVKYRDRLVVHSSMDSLYQHVPLKYLPQDYGGENGRIEDLIAAGEELLMKYREYLAEEELYGIDEELRSGNSTTVKN